MKEAFEKIRKIFHERVMASELKVRELDDLPFNLRKCYDEMDLEDARSQSFEEALSIVSEVEAEYKDKFTSVGAYEQVAWERNVAIAQLKELGYSLGEKIRKVEAEYGNGWIPCSERLPEKYGRYLVCNDGFAWIADFFNSTWFGKRCRYSDVIAWQPLPTPYKEDDHAKKN